MMPRLTLMAVGLAVSSLIASAGLAGTTDVGATINEYIAADPLASPVTLENVATNDRFWPFRITLEEDWTPQGSSETIAARPGVLVRVNDDRTVRVDFARLGVLDVPIEKTNLIEAANRVRLGVEVKMAPNLILTIGNKLIDTTRERVHVFHIPRDSPVRAVLCVFADPNASEFLEVARALETFSRREDLQIVVFPNTELRDLGLWKRFREVGLEAPFVRDRYKEPFFRSLLPSEQFDELPYVQLVTKEGRLLVEGAFGIEVLERVVAILG